MKQRSIIILTAIASIFMMSCNSNSSQKDLKTEKENLSVTEASVLLNENAILIDVREPDEVAEKAYDVKDVQNIPLGDMEKHLSEIPKDKKVILACKAGGRSAKAFEILKKNGFTNIANLDGGMNAWDAAGLPTKTGDTPKKSCCSNPNSKDCNPDGTCKKPSSENINDSKFSSSNTETKTAASNISTKKHLEVYCFHGTRQCETCKNMKANTKATLDKYFSAQLKNGSIVFSIIDVDDPKNEKLAEKFQATGTALMINNVVDGKDNITDWSDFAFEKANDETKFNPELKAKIESFLK